MELLGTIAPDSSWNGGDPPASDPQVRNPEPSVSRAVQLVKSVRVIWSTASMVMSVPAPVV